MNLRKPIDKVRASRDGHEYHEVWVARKSLQLLSPTSNLVAIAVEGLSPNDQRVAKKEEIEIADVTLYYGGNHFRAANQVEILQFKYSIANKNKAFRISDSKETVKKFATTYKSHIERFGGNISSKLRFQIFTNRPIHISLLKAIENLSKGLKNTGDFLAQENQFKTASGLTGRRLVEFASLCDFISSTDLLSASKRHLEHMLISLSASNDYLAIARLGKLRDLVREKAGLAGDSQNVIQLTDILDTLGIKDLQDMIPCPEALSEWGESIEREQTRETLKLMENLQNPLVIHATGGVGKTVFMKNLADKISESHETVFFDSFGGGGYRSIEDARHLPKRGLIHIANTLSFRGLCDPILPGNPDEQTLINEFRQRLKQCLEYTSKIKKNRKIFLFIDAIDNAEFVANQREENSFSKILLESFYDNPIENVKLIMSCRSERKPTTYAKYSEIELKPFSKNETIIFCNKRLQKTTEIFLDSVFLRSGGNARVLEYLIESESRDSHDSSQINLDDLLTERIESAIENATKKGCLESDLIMFLSGLTMLAPPVKIEDYALANDIDTSVIKSMISDLTPLIEESQHGVIFKDEPTETLILKKYSTQRDDLRRIAQNLSESQGSSVFAAKVLPSFLYELQEGEKLYSLASDERFPFSGEENPIGKRRIKISRLKFAIKYAAKQSDFNKLIEFLVELSSFAKTDQKDISYLLNYPELIVTSNNLDAIRRVVEDRTVSSVTRHARLGLIHTLCGDLEEAHQQIFWLDEWIEHYNRRSNENLNFEFIESPDSKDYASIPTFLLAKHDPLEAASYFLNWKDWYSFEIAKDFYRYLPILRDKNLITQKEIDSFHIGLRNAGVIVASLNFYKHSKEIKKRLTKILVRIIGKQKIKFNNSIILEDNVTFQKSILSTSLNTFKSGNKKNAKIILSSLDIKRSRIDGFRDHYCDKSISIFLLKSVVSAVISQKQSVSLIDLLPEELFEIGKNIKKTDYNEFVEELQDLVLKSSENSDKGKEQGTQKKHDIDIFIRYNFPLIYNFTNNIFNFICSSNLNLETKFKSMISFWEEISKNNNIHNSHTAHHLLNEIGFELIAFALNGHTNIQPENMKRLMESENLIRLSVSKKIDLVRIFSLIFPNDDLSGELAIKLSDQIESEDDASSKANLFARIAQTLLPFNKDESLSYFSKGLLAVDGISYEDYNYIRGLLMFSGSFHGDELNSKDFHTLNNICELDMGDEPHKFDWELYGSAYSKLAGLKGLAQLSRWDDQQKIFLSNTLLPYLIALVRDKKISPKDAISLNYLALPAEYRGAGTADFSKVLVASPETLSHIEVSELIYQHRRNHTGTTNHATIGVLAELAQEILGQSSPEYIHLKNAIPIYKELINKTNHHRNLHSSLNNQNFKKNECIKRKKTEKFIISLVKKTNFKDKQSLNSALLDFERLDNSYEMKTLFFSELRKKVNYHNRIKYIENIVESDGGGRLNLHWKIEEIKKCKSKWSSSSLSLVEHFKNFGLRLLHNHFHEFVGDSYIHRKHLEEISEISGVSTPDLTIELVKICTSHNLEVSGLIWISFASFLNSKADDGVAQSAIKKILSQETIKLEKLDSKRQWKPGMYPENNQDKILAEIIWKTLGSPNATERWRATHSIRCFAKFDRWTLILQLVEMIERKEAGAFQDSDQIFFDYHARLWLLIVLARLSIDYPRKIEDFKNLIDPYTKCDHVLFRHFASKIILNCSKTNLSLLTVQEQRSLENINKSPFLHKNNEKIRLDSYGERPETALPPKLEFSLDYDFRKTDVDFLGKVFGIDCWQMDDLIAENVNKINPNISSMSEKGGRSSYQRYSYSCNDREQIYGEHVAWHALQISAGQLLNQHPMTSDYEGDNSWEQRLSSYTLTRNDDFWLSDALDLIPLDVKRILLKEKKGTLFLTEKKSDLLNLANIFDSIRNFLVVGGCWHSIDGITVEISSAFIPKELSKSFSTTLSKKDPFQVFIPSFRYDDDDDDDDDDDHIYKEDSLIPWLILQDAYSKLDQYDPYGAIAGCQRYHIIKDITEGYGLKCTDQFLRYWCDENKNIILKSEAWKGPAIDREDVEYFGLRLQCDTGFLKQILSDCNLNLILVISLRHYQKSHANNGKFAHSIGIIEINENLNFTYRKGEG